MFDDGSISSDYSHAISEGLISIGADVYIVCPAQPTDLSAYAASEDGIALAFASVYKDSLKFCHHSGKWYQWTGTRWIKEETRLAFHWARELCRTMNVGGAAALTKAKTAAEVERFAQADRAFAVTSGIWDRDKFLLGTPGGTVDLCTGELRQPRREDFITKQTPVAPDFKAKHPKWTTFLNESTKENKDYQRFLQQFAGYCLTGDTREDALLFVYGDGGNGKTVFINVLSKMLGDYALKAAMQTFTVSRTDNHPTEIASLVGARMVYASETEEGREWAEARIKEMTGGERSLRARFMRRDEFEFEPTFKLLFFGNFKPRLRNVTEATRRRFNIAPFVNKPEKKDALLEAKLDAELPAILAWAINGCLDWQENGLLRPSVVTAATDTYFGEQDIIRQWIDECCDENGSGTRAALFGSWKAFAERNKERENTSTWFYDVLRRLGFEEYRSKKDNTTERGFKGISLKAKDTSNQWQNLNDS